MTPAEWILDALQHVAGWNASHADLDRARAALPSDEAREGMRLFGSSQTADMLDAQERGIADVMRDLDAQVQRTMQDVRATIASLQPTDARESVRLLNGWDHPLARWAIQEINNLPMRGVRLDARLAARAPLAPSTPSAPSALPAVALLALGALVLFKVKR